MSQFSDRPPELHAGNMMGLATDPDAMEQIKASFDRAVSNVLRTVRPDLDQVGLIASLTQADPPQLAVNLLDVASDATPIRPLLVTLDTIAAGIHDVVRPAAPDDEAMFDVALARTEEILRRHKVDPRLASIFTETVVAAIHVDTCADRLLTTVYPDGRLLLLKCSLLNRLLQMHQQYIARQAAQA